MKRIFMSAVVLMLATAAVQAQSDTTNSRRHEQRMRNSDGPFKDLNLTADQKAKMKSLRDDFKQKQDALAAQKLTEAERRTQMQALRQQQHTEMDAILTPEQKAQLEKWRADHKDGMRDGKRWNGRDSANHRGAMMKQLHLSTDQQAKVKAIRTDFKAKAESLRSDGSLSDAQRKEKFQVLRKQQQEQLKTVLTKEQQEKWRSLRKERTDRNTR